MANSPRITTPPLGSGQFDCFSVADSTGSAWQYEVPAKQAIEFHTIMYRFTGDNTGSTRQPLFVIFDPNAGNVDFVRIPLPDQAINAEFLVCLFQGADTQLQASFTPVYQRPIPGPGTLWLPGMKIEATDAQLTGGDTYTEIRICCTRYIIGPA